VSGDFSRSLEERLLEEKAWLLGLNELKVSWFLGKERREEWT